MLHTRLDPASNTGATVLAIHFISQSAPDIRRKFKKAKDGPQTPIRDLVNMALKVFTNREAEAEAARQARLQQKVALRPAANTLAQGRSLSPGQITPHQGPVSSAAKKDTGPTSVLNLGHQQNPAPTADSLATGGMSVPLEACP